MKSISRRALAQCKFANPGESRQAPLAQRLRTTVQFYRCTERRRGACHVEFDHTQDDRLGSFDAAGLACRLWHHHSRLRYAAPAGDIWRRDPGAPGRFSGRIWHDLFPIHRCAHRFRVRHLAGCLHGHAHLARLSHHQQSDRIRCSADSLNSPHFAS